MRIFLIVLGLCSVGLAIWLAWPSINIFLAGRSVAELIDSLRSLGPWAPFVSLGLMVLQTVIMPIPGAVVSAANGALFGVGWGTFLSWVGGLLGSSLAFWLARWFGAGLVARFASSERIAQLDQLSSRYGFRTLLLIRLIPGISVDLVSYLAGLTTIKYTHFVLATAIGLLPGAFVFNLLGHDLLQAQAHTGRIGIVLALIVGAGLFGRWWWRQRLG
jgi:uncharacterized membrane protein YdjX (TVP38/TMEM64 family)